MPRLVFTAEGSARRVVPLAGEPVSVGRASENTVAFPEFPGLSRRHLRIEPRGRGWAAVNLGSKNGFEVNGVAVKRERLLQDGDVIHACGIVIEMRADEPLSQETILSTTRLRDTPITSLGGHADAVWAFLRAGQELGRRRPLRELFPVLLNLAMEASGAERGALLTMEAGVLAARASSGGTIPVSHTVRERVLLEGRSLLVEDVLLDETVRGSETITEGGVRSLIAVPLQTNERVIGMIYLESTESARRFTKGDLHLLTVISYFGGILIEREEWDMARRALLADNAAALQRLAAALSHEVNTPLGTLRSAVDVLFRLADRPRDAEAAATPERIEKIQADLRRTLDQSLGRMGEVIGRIQRFTNLDRAEVQAVDLNILLLDMLTLRLSGEEEGPKLRVELGELPEVVCRPLALNIALSPLLERAVESAKRRGAEGTIRLRTESGPDEVRVLIEDNGPALPCEVLAGIFDPRFVVEGDRVAASNWDLYTARNVLHEQGGELRVESGCEGDGNGNRVTVALAPRPKREIR